LPSPPTGAWGRPSSNDFSPDEGPTPPLLTEARYDLSGETITLDFDRAMTQTNPPIGETPTLRADNTEREASSFGVWATPQRWVASTSAVGANVGPDVLFLPPTEAQHFTSTEGVAVADGPYPLVLQP